MLEQIKMTQVDGKFYGYWCFTALASRTMPSFVCVLLGLYAL